MSEHTNTIGAGNVLLASRRAQRGLLGEIENIRRTVAESRELLDQFALPAQGTGASGEGTSFAAIRELITRIEQMPRPLDPLDDLVAQISGLISSKIDPLLLAGVLLEGIIQGLIQRVPRSEWHAVLLAIGRIVAERLDSD